MSAPPQDELDHIKILKSSGWMVGMSAFNRLLGLLSLFILARLLTPLDFGVVAIVMIVIQLAETLSEIGSEQYYIQLSEVDDDILNQAWTFNLVVKVLVSLVLLCVSPFLAGLFDSPQALLPLITMSFLPMINATANGYIYELKRSMQFALYAKLLSVVRLVSSITTIILAWVLQSYWAIFAGLLVMAVLQSAFSYLFLPKRTRCTLSGDWLEQFNFSKWIILKSFVGHGRAKFDVWFASSVSGLSGLGGYNLAKDLVLLPSREFVTPVIQVLYSSFSRKQGADSDQQKIYLSLSAILLICMPIAASIALISQDLVNTVLDQKWQPYVITMQWLSPLVITFSLGNYYSAVLTANNQVRRLFWFDLVTFIFSVLLFLNVVGQINQIESIAMWRTFIGIGIVLSGLIMMAKSAGLSVVRLLLICLLPLLASTIMYQFTMHFIPAWSPWWHLLATIIVAMAIYVTSYAAMCFLGKQIFRDHVALCSGFMGIIRR